MGHIYGLANLTSESHQGTLSNANAQSHQAPAENTPTQPGGGVTSAGAGLVDTTGGSLVQFIDDTDDIISDTSKGGVLLRVERGLVSRVEELKRPVLVYSYTFNNASTTMNFDPLLTWHQSVYVARKLVNHALVHTGGLHLKVVTNGSPYNYGMFLLGFWPRYAADSYATSVAVASPTRISTLPLSACVNATVDSVIEWDLPEFMAVDDVITNASPTYGAIVGAVCCGLNNLSGVGGTCTMTFYVNPRDPVVEYVSGAASAYATSDSRPSAVLSSVADAFKAVSTLPIIGPYATSAGTAARLGSRVAHMLGFSRVDDASQNVVLNRMTGDLAVVDKPDHPVKFTYSSSAQTSIDPRTLGLPPVDEMAIDFIKRRWSFTGSGVDIPWASTDAVNTVSGSFNVTPNLGPVLGVGTPICPTNLQWLAAMAMAWSGSIELKFVFNASVFHTGRVQIFYEPEGSAVITGELTMVTQNVIVDLAQQREVIMTIPFVNNLPMMPTNSAYTQLPFTAGYCPFTNGKVGVKVLSPLLGGTAASTVKINVWIRGGEDFTIYGPNFNFTDGTNGLSFFPSGTPGSYANTTYAAFGACATLTSTVDSNRDAVVCMTEPITSLRQMTARYSFTRQYPRVASAGHMTYFSIRDFPAPAQWVSQGSFFENSTAWGPLNWLMGSYAGYKGSIKTKVVPDWADNCHFYVFRDPQNSVGEFVTGGVAASTVSMRNLMTYGNFAGLAHFVMNAGGPAEFTYENFWNRMDFRFCPRHYTIREDTVGPGVIVFDPIPTGQSAAGGAFNVFKAGGPDFSFYCYMGPPAIYLQALY